MAAAKPPIAPLSADTIVRIERFCGDCHAMPLPSTFPKSRWPEEVRQGFDFYIDSKRTDLVEPSRHDVVRYFQEAAPEKVVVPRADGMPTVPSSIRFQPGADLGTSEGSSATAQLNWDVATRSLLVTDMRAGTLRLWQPGNDELRLVTTGKNICRVTRCDWNGDGLEDLLLGEMGSFPVGDHHAGCVTLMLKQNDGTWNKTTLANELARVVEAIPIDYDEDGDWDVLVAEFGWRKTGALKLLRNMGGSVNEPDMRVEILDDKHGVLGVKAADMDGDSRLDFVVAYGQEFESVEIYFNRSAGNWDKKIIFKLPDPSYNASAFEVVDLDNDGRLEIVHTCGDTMDALIAKPYHGVRWLRNMGDRQWENHELGLLVGALQPTVADFDQDGDLDIAAVGLFPNAQEETAGAYDSICWWEQRENLQFIRHSIQRDQCSHAACTVGDVDGDGRIDLIVGEWLNPSGAGFRVFFNQPATVSN